MWIRRPTAGYESKARANEFSALHLVWRDDSAPIYIMDNHRAALWAWVSSLRREERYTFFHADFHWDLRSTPEQDGLASHIESLRDLDAFDKLPRGRPGDEFWAKGRGVPMIGCDDYILPFFDLFRGADAAHFGVCQNRGEARGANWPFCPFRSYAADEFIDRLPELLRTAPSRTIVNVDLDLFSALAADELSTDLEEDAPPVERAKIAPLFTSIRAHLGDAHALTIALSPEYTGGWEEARDACAEACQVLGIENPFDHIGDVERL